AHVADAGNLPAGRIGRYPGRGDAPGAVAGPQVQLAGGGVDPQGIGVTVGVEIPDPRDREAFAGLAAERTGAGSTGAVHQPVAVLAGGCIEPVQIALSVPVGVAGAHQGPAGRIRAQRSRGELAVGIAEPDVEVAQRRVAPHQVRTAVAIEVAGGDDRVTVRDVADGRAASTAGAVHQPVRELAVARVLPQDVAEPVAIDVVTGIRQRHHGGAELRNDRHRLVHAADVIRTGAARGPVLVAHRRVGEVRNLELAV